VNPATVAALRQLGAAFEALASALEADASVTAADRPPGRDLTIAEVAQRVGRSSSTVRAWCAAGRLRGYKLRGRDYRIPPAALQEFLARERHTGAAPQLHRGAA